MLQNFIQSERRKLLVDVDFPRLPQNGYYQVVLVKTFMKRQGYSIRLVEVDEYETAPK